MKIAIVGYGNIGRAAETLLAQFPDLSPSAIYTRRDPQSLPRLRAEIPLLPFSEIDRSDADCLILAGASDSDLPDLSPRLAKRFHIADSFDTHKKLPEHVDRVGKSAEEGGRVAVLAAGWDPGMLSLARIYLRAFLPYAKVNTFWGEGVSQGHSAVVRHLPGVKDAKAYTLPNPRARLLAGQGIAVSDAERHSRRVFVLPEEDADREAIARQIRRIPDYFAGYETEVVFLGAEEFRKNCSGLPHRGEVIAVGRSGRFSENRGTAKLSLTMDSNPEFTAAILLSSARAALRLAAQGRSGAFTFADIPPKYFLPEVLSPYSLL